MIRMHSKNIQYKRNGQKIILTHGGEGAFKIYCLLDRAFRLSWAKFSPNNCWSGRSQHLKRKAVVFYSPCDFLHTMYFQMGGWATTLTGLESAHLKPRLWANEFTKGVAH